MITIYHNPRCSKSRETLARVQQFSELHSIDLNVVDYQKTPLSSSQLNALHRTLQSEGKVSVRDMVRDGEEVFSRLNLEHADQAALLDAIAAHPVLLQRPIVTFNGRGIVARPPELVEGILQAS
jgi:arsenate reductase (glutaredoxin)